MNLNGSVGLHPGLALKPGSVKPFCLKEKCSATLQVYPAALYTSLALDGFKLAFAYLLPFVSSLNLTSPEISQLAAGVFLNCH